MAHAFKEVYQDGDRIVLIGSDLWNLNISHIHQAFYALDKFDLVIAPAEDGGYGLIGLKNVNNLDLFDIGEYSNDGVLSRTLLKARQLNFDYTLLNPVTDVDIPQDLLKIFLRAERIEHIGSGEYNINYRYHKNGKDFVFRINKGSQIGLGKKQILYEYHALKALEKSGVVPKVYSVFNPNLLIPYGSLIMDYIEGRPLNYDKDLCLAAHLLSKIHNTMIESPAAFLKAHQPFKEMFHECSTLFEKYLTWDKKEKLVCTYIERFFHYLDDLGYQDSASPSCMINTELNNRNFLISDRGPSFVIDWEKPIIGEPEQDLAHFIAPTTTFWKTDTILSEEQIKVFIYSYRQFGKVDEDKLKKYVIFTCLRGLTWCAMAKRQYDENSKLKNPDTYLKIQQYLSEPFLKIIERNYMR